VHKQTPAKSRWQESSALKPVQAVFPGKGVGKLHCHRQLCNRNENLAMQNGLGDPFPAIGEMI
jgi:hypothetical protein